MLGKLHTLDMCTHEHTHSRSLAHHDEEDEVEPVPEGVRVLHEVQDVGPALEADYLKGEHNGAMMHIQKQVLI